MDQLNFNQDNPSEESKKTKRISISSQACSFCKKRHLKCDGKQPCSQCISRNMDCVFGSTAKRGRKTNKNELVVSNFISLYSSFLFHRIPSF